MNKLSFRRILCLGVFILIASVFCPLENPVAQAFEGKQLQQENTAKARLISLTEGIAMALKDNRLIKIGFSEDEISRQDSFVFRSALLPQMDVSATKTYFRFQPASRSGSQVINTSEKQPFAYGASIYQTLFDFGKSISNYHAALDLTSARAAQTQAARRAVILEFVVAYFDLLEVERMTAVFEKQVESLNAYARDVELMYEQGIVVKNDLLPAKVKLADAKQKLIETRNQREIAASRLNNILALPLREKVTVQDIVLALPRVPDLDIAWETAHSQRPEVVFFDNQLAASAASERAKAVENFPLLYAKGGYAYEQNKFLSHKDNMTFMLGVKMNLYDGGASHAQLLKERARQAQIKDQQQKLIEDIRFEVENSFFGLKNADEKKAVAQDSLGQAEENVRYFRAKFAAGSATATEVLEAITSQTQAQTNYYRSDYELKRNYASLMYSMGIDLALLYERMEQTDDGYKK
jgi:outer membrane protein